MEAEHYPNGVLESMSTRIVNGAYKHEDLQTDESSMGKAMPPHGVPQAALLSPGALSPLWGLGWAGFGGLRSSIQIWSTASLANHESVLEVGRPQPAAQNKFPAFVAGGSW